MNTDPTTTTTSVEVKAEKSIWGRVWAYQPAKEFILVVASAIAAQLAFGLADLVQMVDTAEDWSDLLTSVGGWVNAFTFALVITVLKQSMAWGIARLAGTKL